MTDRSRPRPALVVSVERLVAEAGGRLESMWLTDVGERDIVLLLDMDGQSSSEAATATLARRA